jgi:SAM-dependent methyltransferase
LTRANLSQQGLTAGVAVVDGERLPFPDSSFDFVYAHGVIQYAADDGSVVAECHRVLRPGGTVMFQVYNRVSWLHLLSIVMKVPLEHEDAPVLRRYSIPEFRALLRGFVDVRLVPERFPVKSRLHKGWKGVLFNAGFVGLFNALPRRLVRRFGWHLLAFCRKGDA